MRALISLLLAASVGLLAAQAFGRFGYVDEGQIPGFLVNKSGFAVRHGNADTFRFAAASRVWKPIQTNPVSQTVQLSGVAPSPDKLKQELLAPGFSLHFANGFRFQISSLKSPFLTWNEGTLEGDAGYPTPETKWVLISFRNDQPPVLLAFPGKKSAVHCWGKPGEWYIGTKQAWEGWIRICSPFGVRGKRANTASELGEAAKQITANETVWTQPTPQIVESHIEDDEQGLTVETTFDRPGAVVPFALSLAPLAGTPVRIATPLTNLEAPTEEGPLVVATSNKLSFRLLARRIPTGRAVALGDAPSVQQTVSHLDHEGVTELAIGNLLAGIASGTTELAETTIGQFISEAVFENEPFTGQAMSYSADGKGMDLTAAYSLLMQSGLAVKRPTSEANSFFTSLTWRRDFLSWRLWAKDRILARRAAALAALAACLMPEAERRLEGAYLQAGLAAEIGLEVWRRRNGLPYENTPQPETMSDMLAELYQPPDYRRPSSYTSLVMSPIRAYGVVGLVAKEQEGKIQMSLPVTLDSSGMFMLTSGFSLDGKVLSPDIGATFEQAFGMGVVRWNDIKTTQVLLLMQKPRWAELPQYPKEIRYQERLREIPTN